MRGMLRVGPVRSLLVLGLCLILPAVARTQALQMELGAIEGVVSTQSGTITLPSALVSVRDTLDVELNESVADTDGHFRITDLQPGTYRVRVSFSGFVTKDTTVTVIAGAIVRANVDLEIEGRKEIVDVVAAEPVVSSGDTISGSSSIGSQERDQFAPGAGLSGAVRLLISAIEVPGGVSIKGGRPTQAGMQIGATSVTDPSLGLPHMTLPDDAIESVAVLPNPYAVEYGRFSSGLVLIETRRAGDQWKIRLNNLNPTFRTGRSQYLLNIKGIAGLSPRIEVGGPIVKGRLFLEQSAQYKYNSDEVPSLPEDERRTSHWLSSFTRVDANVSPRHTLTVTGGIFPARASYANLGTFTPPEATLNARDQVNHVGVTERTIWSPSVVGETTFQATQFDTRVTPQGAAPMEILAEPPYTVGNFFNTSRRTPSVFQWTEVLSATRNGAGGLHLFKFGVDVLRSHFQGTSDSRPLTIRDKYGNATRALTYTGPSTQDVRSSDVAFFAQDRFQPTNRWYIEVGGRMDRDGILQSWNFTPRAGAAFLLNATGTSVLRGGVGLFYERTPSAAGAFEQFEVRTETRFAADGITPLATPVTFTPFIDPNLETARSTTWDVAWDYRMNPRWSFRASVIERRDHAELIVDPRIVDPVTGAGQLVLSSTGEGHYRDLEVGFHFSRLPRSDADVGYLFSSARGEFNPFANFFNIPIAAYINPNASADGGIPHRILARGRLMPTDRWLLLGVVEWRSGAPFSKLEDTLDYVPGPRNTERFPDYFRLDLGIERRFHIGKFQPWIGLRIPNALDTFNPTDVQANTGSSSYGQFYNSDYRELRLQIRFER